MKHTSLLVLIAALLFGGVALAAAPPGGSNPANPARQINIKIMVDSKDKIMIRGKHLWIEHEKPGAIPSGIFINRRSWQPIWHGNKTEMLNRFGVVLGPFENAKVTLRKVAGRGTVILEQQPTAENQQTIEILFDDPFSGPDAYEVTISW